VRAVGAEHALVPAGMVGELDVEAAVAVAQAFRQPAESAQAAGRLGAQGGGEVEAAERHHQRAGPGSARRSAHVCVG
jgi:hypothetical protein